MRKRVLFVTMMLAFGLTACGNNADNQSETSEVVEDVSNEQKEDADSDSSDSADAEEEVVLEYMLNQSVWGEEKDLTGLPIFCDRLTLPITIEKIDSACAPYVYTGYSGDFEYDRVNATTLEEISNIEYTFIDDSFELEIDVQKSIDWKDDGTYEYSYVDDYDCNLSEFAVDDLKETGMSVKDAINNGYWYMYRIDSLASMIEEIEQKSLGDVTEMDYFLYTYGRPSYAFYEERFYEDCSAIVPNNEEGKVRYTLVYEREEYAITIDVIEDILKGKHYVTLGSLTYYASGYWNDYKELNKVDTYKIELK